MHGVQIPFDDVLSPSTPQDSNMVCDMEIDEEAQPLLGSQNAQSLPVGGATLARKRKGIGKTPVVDDEVRRCSRFKKGASHVHIRLDKEPRKNGEAKKTVSFSSMEDLRAAIVTRNLEDDMEAIEVEPIQPVLLLELGSSFCGVPPKEMNLATLQEDEEVDQ